MSDANTTPNGMTEWLTGRGIRRVALFAIALVSALVAFGLFHSAPLLSAFEAALSDRARMAFAPSVQSQDKRISFVSLDEATMATLPYRSPIDRAFLAGLVTQIGAAGAKAIGLDVLFDQPTEATKDAQLAAALRDFPGVTVIAWADARSGMTEKQSAWLEAFGAESGATFGFANLLSTANGVVREHSATLPGANQRSFASVLARREAPTDNSTKWVIDWIRPAQDGTPTFQTTPALVVPLMQANPAILETWFKDRIVIVGADLPLVDRHETPLSTQGLVKNAIPGAVIHAHIISQILDGRIAREMTRAQTFMILFGLAALATLLGQSQVRLTMRMIAGVAVLIVYFGAMFSLIGTGGAPGPVAAAFVTMACGFLGGANYDAFMSRKERRFIQSAFGQYLAPELVEQLIEDPDALKVGGRRRTLSFMFTDIAGFTTLSEQMDPDGMAEMLNRYLDGVCEIIIANNGVIDKFIGDAVVALFGVPNGDLSHAANAIACARQVDAFCEAFRAKPGHEKLGETRIGVHTGLATVGNFGGHARFDYTAIGDAMNTAARLESANKTFGTRIAVSGDCLAAAEGRLSDDTGRQLIGRVVLKGKSEPLLVATFKKDNDLEWKKRYDHAYAELDAAPENAMRLFADLRPDPVAAFHLSRLESGETGSLIFMKGK